MVRNLVTSRRSSSIDRRRSRSRHNSVASASSSVNLLLDDNNYEMYSGQHLKLSHLQLLHCIILIVLVGEEYHVYLEKHHLYLVLMKMIMTCNELDQTPRGILLILRLIFGFLSR